MVYHRWCAKNLNGPEQLAAAVGAAICSDVSGGVVASRSDCVDRGDVVMTVAEWRESEPELEEDDENDTVDLMLPGVTTHVTKTLNFTVVDTVLKGMAIMYVRTVIDTQTTVHMMVGDELHETCDYTTEMTNYEIVGPWDLLRW